VFTRQTAGLARTIWVSSYLTHKNLDLRAANNKGYGILPQTDRFEPLSLVSLDPSSPQAATGPGTIDTSAVLVDLVLLSIIMRAKPSVKTMNYNERAAYYFGFVARLDVKDGEKTGIHFLRAVHGFSSSSCKVTPVKFLLDGEMLESTRTKGTAVNKTLNRAYRDRAKSAKGKVLKHNAFRAHIRLLFHAYFAYKNDPSNTPMLSEEDEKSVRHFYDYLSSELAKRGSNSYNECWKWASQMKRQLAPPKPRNGETANNNNNSASNPPPAAAGAKKSRRRRRNRAPAPSGGAAPPATKPAQRGGRRKQAAATSGGANDDAVTQGGGTRGGGRRQRASTTSNEDVDATPQRCTRRSARRQRAAVTSNEDVVVGDDEPAADAEHFAGEEVAASSDSEALGEEKPAAAGEEIAGDNVPAATAEQFAGDEVPASSEEEEVDEQDLPHRQHQATQGGTPCDARIDERRYPVQLFDREEESSLPNTCVLERLDRAGTPSDATTQTNEPNSSSASSNHVYEYIAPAGAPELLDEPIVPFLGSQPSFPAEQRQSTGLTHYTISAKSIRYIDDYLSTYRDRNLNEGVPADIRDFAKQQVELIKFYLSTGTNGYEPIAFVPYLGSPGIEYYSISATSIQSIRECLREILCRNASEELPAIIRNFTTEQVEGIEYELSYIHEPMPFLGSPPSLPDDPLDYKGQEPSGLWLPKDDWCTSKASEQDDVDSSLSRYAHGWITGECAPRGLFVRAVPRVKLALTCRGASLFIFPS
jgi:hypothetical protein